MPITKSQDGALNIAYEVQGSGPPVVFVHAFPLGRELWRPQLEALPGHRLIALDLRGFGESSPNRGETTIAALAGDVRAVLQATGEPTAHLVGCSMGGYVLLELLRQVPEIARSLAFIDTRAAADTAEGRRQRLQTVSRLRSDPRTARPEFERAMSKKLLGETSRRERPNAVRLVDQMMAQATLEGITGALEAMAGRPDSTGMLSGLDRPALVIVGEEDALITVEESGTMAERLAEGRLLVVPQAGHLPSLERPEALQEPLLELWRQGEHRGRS